MKILVTLFILLFYLTPALAEEEGGHEERKSPPKPFKGSPLEAVLELPVVMQWSKWMEANKGHIRVWGESINNIKGDPYWTIVVGEQRQDGVQVWRKFCVPQQGGDILVQNITTSPDDTIIYNPYPKWVTECKPTVNSGGSC